MTNYVKVIQQEQIDALNIDPATCVEWVKEAFLMKDNIQMPAKMSVHPQGEDFITSMPCLLPEKEFRRQMCDPSQGMRTDPWTLRR